MISIHNSLRDLIQTYGDFLITDSAESCKLIYPAKRESCPNCKWDSQSQKSSGIYKPGGPYPFSNTPCPYCNGVGFKEIEVSETVQLKLKWFNLQEQVDIAKSLENATIPNDSVRLPYGVLRTRFFESQLPQILRANKLIPQTPTEHLQRSTYERITEPINNNSITKNRYFQCYWSRLSG